LAKKRGMHDLLLIAGVVAGWFLLQMWVLPKFGVGT
jgi:hypothetical protein